VQTLIDTAIANIVDGAPDLLNTLNELSAAVGDDANFITTIQASVDAKVAKAGDTMTGDLTLAQDPTSNLHAASKQYVDAAETAANTYSDSLIGDGTIDGTAGNTVADRLSAAGLSPFLLIGA